MPSALSISNEPRPPRPHHYPFHTCHGATELIEAKISLPLGNNHFGNAAFNSGLVHAARQLRPPCSKPSPTHPIGHILGENRPVYIVGGTQPEDCAFPWKGDRRTHGDSTVLDAFMTKGHRWKNNYCQRLSSKPVTARFILGYGLKVSSIRGKCLWKLGVAGGDVHPRLHGNTDGT